MTAGGWRDTTAGGGSSTCLQQTAGRTQPPGKAENLRKPKGNHGIANGGEDAATREGGKLKKTKRKSRDTIANCGLSMDWAWTRRPPDISFSERKITFSARHVFGMSQVLIKYGLGMDYVWFRCGLGNYGLGMD